MLTGNAKEGDILMKWKRKFGMILLFGIMLTITGCEKKPETTMRDGIAFADPEVSEQEDGFETQENNVEENMAANIETEIVTDISTMKINAQISNLPAENESYMGIVENKTIDIENLQGIFFGGEFSNQLNDENVDGEDGKNNETAEGIDNVESQPLLNSEQTGTWVLMDESNQKEIAQLSIDANGTLAFINLELNRKYPNNTSISIEALGEIDAPATTLTREGAIKELEEIINKMEAPKIEILSCLAYQDSNGKGYYELNFVPIFHGIALTNGLPSFSDNNVVEIFGRAIITEDGVMELVGNFMIEYKDKKAEKILTDEEIVKTLTKYLNSGRILTTSEAPINRIQYEYLAKYSGGEIKIIPIWHLYFDEEKIENIDTTEFSVQGIGIGASDGELEFAY